MSWWRSFCIPEQYESYSQAKSEQWRAVNLDFHFENKYLVHSFVTRLLSASNSIISSIISSTKVDTGSFSHTWHIIVHVDSLVNVHRNLKFVGCQYSKYGKNLIFARILNEVNVNVIPKKKKKKRERMQWLFCTCIFLLDNRYCQPLWHRYTIVYLFLLNSRKLWCSSTITWNSIINTATPTVNRLS